MLKYSLLSFIFLATGAAHAQNTPAWPSKPIRLVVGFAAAGPTDIVARAFGDSAARGLGQPVVIDNKPGANSIIAAEVVASAAADGYTLLLAATNHTTIPALYSNRVKFDALKSFKPICAMAHTPTVLVVGPALGVKTLGEFIQRAKANPMKVSYATPGIGSTAHFASELFANKAEVRMNHVPYKGAAPALTDLMSGQVDASFATLGSVLPHIRAGKLTALAIATRERLPQLAAVPTFEEEGIRAYAVDAWYGLLAPAQLPLPQVKTLEQQAQEFVASAAGAEKLRGLGMEPRLLCGEAFAAQMAAEVETYSRIAKDLKLQVE